MRRPKLKRKIIKKNTKAPEQKSGAFLVKKESKKTKIKARKKM